MKYKTRSIVFNFIKFRESSIIARIYTEKYGLKNYLINHVRSFKPRYPVSLFQPLTQLDMVVYNKPGSEINRIAEIKCLSTYHSIPFDVIKSTVCLFLTEILYKILREEEANRKLFDFLLDSFNYYDDAEAHHANFHLQFLLKLTSYLGINPVDVDEIIREIKSAGSSYLISDPEKKQFDQLIQYPYQANIGIDNQGRRKMLTLILLFYQHHFDHISNIKSLRILREVFFANG
jgi:DNA repair protein RecO (recombination protein O)